MASSELRCVLRRFGWSCAFLPLVSLDDRDKLDVAIDGADALERGTLHLIKGGGGAMHREKIVELRADKFVTIVDESKLTDKLGPSFPLPVEVTPFCTRARCAAWPRCPRARAASRACASARRRTSRSTATSSR